jgi:Zn finger protein HypA/HybF involved in hydrogenase expression
MREPRDADDCAIKEDAMPSAQERAKLLAQEMRRAIMEAKTAEARAKRLGNEVLLALAEAKAEAEAASVIIEYPVGRYECRQCGHGSIFSQPYAALPACDNCGSHEYVGADPTVTKITPPAPKRYGVGMYECAACKTRVVLAEETDVLSPCDICGADKLKAV